MKRNLHLRAKPGFTYMYRPRAEPGSRGGVTKIFPTRLIYCL